MTDRPEEGREERRRTGPLGDDDEETRAVPTDDGPGATRRVRSGREEPAFSESRGATQGPSEDKETRVIRAPEHPDTTRAATPYPRGYFEEAEEREDRLRDMYGGVDWLASFLGFVFAIVAGAIFSLIAGLVLAPLGFSVNLGGGEIGAAIITGLVLLGILVFLTYFFGGYVAGRLARFDGGRNGAMLLLWSGVTVLVLALVNAILAGLLPSEIADDINNFIQNDLLSTIGNLSQLGVVGVVVFVGALLLALLGGFLGGRLGSRYHAEIDRTT